MADIIQMPSMDSAPSPELTKRDAKSIMKDAKELMDSLNSMYRESIVKKYQLKPEFVEESIIFSLDDLEGYTDDQLKELYDKYYDGPEDNKLTETMDIQAVLTGAKTIANDIWQTNNEYNEIHKMYGDALVEEFTRKNSKENRQKMMDELESLKEAAKQEDLEPDQKKEIENKISIMESMMSMDFLLKRISTITDNERTRVIKQFFSEKEGGYCLEKCKNKSPKFGYSADWYKFFFNLEENFLPEEYHIYNNLFLYGVMRFIGYSDPYSQEDRVFVSSLLNSLIGLIYHKFPDSAMEEHIVHLIETYDDYFVDYKDKFIAENTTRPGHPVREHAHAEKEADRIKDLVATMIKFNIPVPEDENMSADELQKYFNDEMEKMVAANSKEKESKGIAEVSENEDGTVSVKPTKRKYQKGIKEENGHYYYYNNDGVHGLDDEKMFKLLTDLEDIYNPDGNEDVDPHDTRFMLEVYNPDVRTDLFQDLSEYTEDELKAIYTEASKNIWYFLRFCVRENPIQTQEDIAYVHCFSMRTNIYHKTYLTQPNYKLLQYLLEWTLLFNTDQVSGYDTYDGINVIANSYSIASPFINGIYELEYYITGTIPTENRKIDLTPIVNRPSLLNAAEMPGHYLNVFLSFTKNSWIDSIFPADMDTSFPTQFSNLYMNSRVLFEADATAESFTPNFDAAMRVGYSPRVVVWEPKFYGRTYERFYYAYAYDMTYIYIEEKEPVLTKKQEELVQQMQEKFDTEGGIPVDKFLSGDVTLDSYRMENTAFGSNFDE